MKLPHRTILGPGPHPYVRKIYVFNYLVGVPLEAVFLNEGKILVEECTHLLQCIYKCIPEGKYVIVPY